MSNQEKLRKVNTSLPTEKGGAEWKKVQQKIESIPTPKTPPQKPKGK